jgi:hypothetical protein
LNARITRLSENTLPKQPYLLSVPSDVPYRHSSRFVQTWHVGTPFDRREEQLQYLSFLPHNGPLEDLLKVEGGWADDDGNFVSERERTAPPQSAPNTPPEQANRKKISLKDYKKEKGQNESGIVPQQPKVVPKPEKPLNLKRESTPLEVKKELQLLEVKQEQKPKMPSRSPERREIKPERGRSPVRAADRKPTVSGLDGTTSPALKREDDSRPAKKRKLSGSPPPKPEADRSLPPKRLPKLLSPTLPSSPQRNNELPELLSPLLPPSLMKALATPPSSSRSDSANAHKRSDSVRSILGAINEDGPRSTDKNSLTVGAAGNRVRSDSQHSARSAASPSSKVLSRPGIKAGVSTPNRSPGPRQRHTIALKYGKKNSKRVQALLRFPSRPIKVPVKTVPQDESTKSDPKPLPPREPPKEPPKVKVARDTSPDRPVPKSKPPLSEAIKRPSTPLTNGFRDPKRAASPAMKTIAATPKKELKSSAMRRVESVEGADPSTPGGKPRESTPASVERSRIPKSSPLPNGSSTHDHSDRHAWQQFEKDRDYFTFARNIKHEGSKLADQATSLTEMHKPILLLIEALLGFMLNTAVQTQVRPRTDLWTSILGYYKFIHARTKDFPHLHGLVVQLGAVCRQAIHKANLDRLARDPLPTDEHAGAAPTPGSDGTTKTGAEDAEGSKKKYLAFRDELIDNANQLQTAWLNGSRLLSTELLQKEYQETWRARIKDFEHRGVDRHKPVRTGNDANSGEWVLAKGYYLPLDPASSAFEAVEYALKVMGEWADREDVDWRARLQL